MKRTYQVFAYLLAAEVVIQAMAIAYALAGLGHWIDKDGGVVNHAVFKAWEKHPPTWQGSGGFALHGINGSLFIPVIALLFLIISAFTKLAGATKKAAILFLLVVVQLVLGMALHDVVVLAPLHALNAFILFGAAVMTGVWAGKQQVATEHVSSAGYGVAEPGAQA